MTLRTAGSRSGRTRMQLGLGVYLGLVVVHGVALAADGGVLPGGNGGGGGPTDAAVAGLDSGGLGTAGSNENTGGASATSGFGGTGSNEVPGGTGATGSPDDGGFANSGGNGSDQATASGGNDTSGPTGGAGSDQGTGSGSNDGSSPSAVCSCQTDEGEGARRIHLCTGSFDGAVCDALSCKGTLRKASCDDDSPVRLCCEMEARKLYTYLYADCTHPNCEKGFRAQCKDFAGEVRDGMCVGAPPVPEPPENDDGGSSSCRNAIAKRSTTSSAQSVLWLLTIGLIARRTRMRRRDKTPR